MSEFELPRAQFYPWQREFQDRLTRQITEQKLPHALLFSGVPGIGKKEFALALGALILCGQANAGTVCGNCTSCRLIKAGTHPDFSFVHPLESRQIKIEQVRAVVEWANQTAQQGGRKVAILFPAEQMNQASGNALLKCLEEPPEGTYFLLVTDQPGRLLPTIRSRCQAINFPTPIGDHVLSWLQDNAETGADTPLLLNLAVGAPLRVGSFDSEYLKRRRAIKRYLEKTIIDDTSGIEAAAKLHDKEQPTEVYDVLYEMFADALRLKLSKTNKLLTNIDLSDFIEVISKNYSAQKMLDIIQHINFCRKTLGDTTNPNAQLLLESLFIDIACVSAAA